MGQQRWFYRSEQEWTAICERLKHTPCPHCKVVGTLIRHGSLRGYDDSNPRERLSGRGGSFAATATHGAVGEFAGKSGRVPAHQDHCPGCLKSRHCSVRKRYQRWRQSARATSLIPSRGRPCSPSHSARTISSFCSGVWPAPPPRSRPVPPSSELQTPGPLRPAVPGGTDTWRNGG